jgi:Rieske Fe-S protein
MHVHLEKSATRRRWLRQVLWGAAGLPLLGALGAMLRKIQTRQVPSSVAIPMDVAEGLSILGPALVHRDPDGSIRVFSAQCTHLGCHLDRVADGEGVCPCHGSRFHADGTVAKGPANRPLEALKVEPDKATGGWIARVRT